MNETAERKIEHIRLCLSDENVETKVNYFDDVKLVHVALPELDKSEIDMSTNFLGFNLRYPLLIASMTGGHPRTKDINRALAEAAEEFEIGMGVGSQRAALEDSSLEDSFSVVRDVAPNAFIYANIGVLQLKEYGIEDVERAIEMIDADAIAIHLNFLQEAIQPESESVNAVGCLSAIKEIAKELKKPVIVKETGAGISSLVAEKLLDAGVSAIDVGGFGGTNWAIIEAKRAKEGGNKMKEHLGNTFSDWGIPTTVSILECRRALSSSSRHIPIIATGGIRNGVHIAKSIALGADVSSVGLPFLRAVMRGADGVKEEIKMMCEDLRVAMFLSGCRSINDLKKVQVIITGVTREIIDKSFYRFL